MIRTDGKVIFASGSPYRPVEHAGKVYEPGQCNNMYIFPGIGMGTALAKAGHVTDSMVEQAAIALSSSLGQDEDAAGLVFPRLARIRTLSARIAKAVIRAAQKEVRINFVLEYFQLMHLRRASMKTHCSEISMMMLCWHILKRNSGNRVLSILLVCDPFLGCTLARCLCVCRLVNDEVF